MLFRSCSMDFCNIKTIKLNSDHERPTEITEYSVHQNDDLPTLYLLGVPNADGSERITHFNAYLPNNNGVGGDDDKKEK